MSGRGRGRGTGGKGRGRVNHKARGGGPSGATKRIGPQIKIEFERDVEVYSDDDEN